MVDRIGRANPDADFFTNIFSPYPGSPIWPLAVARGVREPQTLEEWADFHPKIQVLPWLHGRAARAHPAHPRLHPHRLLGAADGGASRAGCKGVAARSLRRLARWRLRTLLVRFPLEVWALRASRR